jgi:acyl carrier protein
MNTKIIALIYQLKPILDDALFLNGRTKNWGNQMSLLGNVPELDSIAVMNVVSALEVNFNIFIKDDDINAEVFTTLESLANLIYEKKNNQMAIAR